MSNNEDLDKYLASTYNLIDHLTERVYGDGIRYEQLSLFGQQHIEALARLQPTVTEPDPAIQSLRADNALLREENIELMNRIASVLREMEELYEELELERESKEGNS
jgi:predicted nuclease with TOPRIM domain